MTRWNRDGRVGSVAGALLLGLLGATTAWTQTDVPHPTARVDTTAVPIGGSVTLTVEIPTPEGWFAEPPRLEGDLGPFRVRNLAETERTSDARRFVARLVAMEAGPGEIPPVEMTVRHGEDEALVVATEGIPVEITSNLPPPDPAATDSAAVPAPAPFKPALEAPRDWRPVIVAAIALILGTALGFLLWRRLRARGPADDVAPAAPRVPARPAWEIALEELDRIAAAGLVERGELRRQYEEVTFAVRRYLEDRYGVPALESTTDELRDRLRRAPVPPEQASRAVNLFAEADLVKFAKATPEATAARDTERRAREFVRATMPAAPAPSTEEAPS
ncbi:MAG: hypothetical protein KC591_01560 [Gemmatimonadetes bacterium]|nr:hypothetical protein [Gemmatimonadota bacterium]